MAKYEVGKFSIENDVLTGPGDYMAEQGNKLVDDICTGNDMVFNMTSGYSPTVEQAILVRLQTDYAGWLGLKQTMQALKR